MSFFFKIQAVAKVFTPILYVLFRKKYQRMLGRYLKTWVDVFPATINDFGRQALEESIEKLPTKPCQNHNWNSVFRLSILKIKSIQKTSVSKVNA